jgi:hypothetical protein
MSRPNLSSLLRPALYTDAIVSGATGVLLVGAAPVLSPWLGLPVELLRVAGLSLVPFVLYVAVVARSTPVRLGHVRAIAIVNLLWVAASLLLMLVGPDSLTGLGYAFIAVQALVVMAFAEFQWMGYRAAATA